ncbi:nuclear autoantigenic sperm protein-like isoform X2 [Syngnathus acus]|uniref:nuclear autoantigenic sperm protein-like isoform X2 n=1 Tax=Syngnathus acus TaxID=161584 RepID=UPI001885CCF4|nr:nuclear autoantigenic sperm protein-like isoform X2 [Syngnathus acus]XP_037106481.1 nuclear autoantigenic sperm protein-like isoform X2 [Syngnathus acus]
MSEEMSGASSSGSGVDEKPCSSSAPATDRCSGDVMEEAKKLIGKGNRHLVMGDIVAAVRVFQDACGMLAARYGDTADECGEAFFLCGKSLLELARLESTVLGNALVGVPEESDDDDEEQPSNSNIESANDLDDEDDDDGEVDKNGDKEEEEDDDVDNLQLAWEMLEVAKVIFKRKENKEQQLMAAQTLLKLGEVGAEAGNYPQALEDFQECLALQLKHLPPHSRLLAETYYHVAAMHCYMDQYGQAVQHYNSSVKVIETRLAMLQNLIAAAESTEEATTEMEELKQLLPDIREKIEDAEEIHKTDSAAIQQTLGGASTSSASRSENGSSSAFAGPTPSPMKSTDGASSSTVASDISHLVRKKRKPEEKSPVKDTDAKQAKQEATLNGTGDSSANNGVEEQKSQEPAVQSSA